ncbi:Rab-GTPase-TBC domain [Dillenia turbinata]|uniref:Rab-GTPase-TBC domain n=1 Tax=Dillenia turbinata TaxID=194707 RepID=A0AAN8W1F5_9MAGN
MTPAPIEVSLLESSSSSNNPSISGENRRFPNLRGVQWRINLGILPSSSSSTIDELRRITADSRRRYASLRRRLLVDPHLFKDGNNSPNLVVDNPLSQNPDSTWGRFFRNAELEKMVDQDLSRLYPEHESYFQTLGCQGMLRRLLLLWCLRHPEYGYRQGMHELLAPLLYVLQVDIEHLCQVRKNYEDHFTDMFDELSFHESDLRYNFDLKKFPNPGTDQVGFPENAKKSRGLDDLDPEVRTILLLSDAYGAEGELGILLSERFMEHDAYCMFDALMSGANGAVCMADFFSPSPLVGSQSGMSPVIEASATFYHLLAIVDSSLYSHLVELGVEPQYFSLRWLRVLFGREFSLRDLLIIWDEIFASGNGKLPEHVEGDTISCAGVLGSHRGAFISGMAVSMMLYLRSSLLATEHATSCLQRLLNFPENVDLRKLMGKAKSLQTLALDTKILTSSTSHVDSSGHNRSAFVRCHTLSSDSVSSRTPLNVVPESYWEEQWRVLHKEEEVRQKNQGKHVPIQKKRWSEKLRSSLTRTESDPSPVKAKSSKNENKSSVRRSLLKDLSQVLGSEDEIDEISFQEGLSQKDPVSAGLDGQHNTSKDLTGSTENTFGSEENSPIFSSPTSPHSRDNDHENESEKSSIVSNSFLEENEYEANNADSSRILPEEPPLPISDTLGDSSFISDGNNNHTRDSQLASVMKERRSLSGKFQWLWKFGKNTGEGTSNKGVSSEAAKASILVNSQSNTTNLPAVDGDNSSSVSDKSDVADPKVINTFRNLGQSMLENIQVIESVFQQERGQMGPLENFSKNVLVGKGQVTAMTALKELRKISNLLSEM